MSELLQRFNALPWDAYSQWLVILPAGVMLLAAAAAVALRNLIHAALCLTLSFIALVIIFIALGAEFVGLVQLLVYVGAVAMLIVFAILLTRPSDLAGTKSPFAGIGPVTGILTGAGLLIVLLAFIFKSPLTKVAMPVAPSAPVADIGKLLMNSYIVPLQVIGVLLTAALIGAAVLAMEDKKP